jgi:hypothetical protein
MTASRRFASKAIVLGACFYAVSLLFSHLFEEVSNWRAWQDPRKRLLYETVPHDTDIVLLGDSIWISSYVDSEQQTLWKVLEANTGKRVFNATLNGADPPDFANAVKLLPPRERPGAVVFLNVVPTRVLPRTFAEPAEGNYAGEFSKLTGDSLARRLYVWLRKPLQIFDTEIVLNVLLRKRHFAVGDDRYRIWSRDGEFALRRFRTFERYVVDTVELRDLEWITTLDARLRERGYQLVVAITPVNRALIRAYATPEKARSALLRLEQAHEALTGFLRKRGIPFVDCYQDATADEFADLIHVNADGDRRIAARLARYLEQGRQE